MSALLTQLHYGAQNAAVALVFLVAIFVPLERSFAARRQPHLREELGLDLVFFFSQYLVFSALLLWFGARLQDATDSLMGPPLVAGLPIALQLLIAVVVGDLSVYWGHRLSHEVPVLWRFHAVHHTVKKLDWLAAHREHPLDGVYSQLFLLLPTFALGVDVTWLAPVMVFRGLWAIFVHSNVRMPLGPLGVLFGDPVLHRWHHARVPRCEHNFANLAPYLDMLFGTHHRPHDENYELGLDNEAGGWVRMMLRGAG